MICIILQESINLMDIYDYQQKRKNNFKNINLNIMLYFYKLYYVIDHRSD